MLRVEVVGGADAETIASQLTVLDRSGLLLVTTRARPAESAPAVALVVAAPSLTTTTSATDLERYVDVVLCPDEPLDEHVANLWFDRLAGFARALAGKPVASSAPRLNPHDRTWAPAADRRLRRLNVALARAEGSADIRFDHIGSTSVPGLRAKPVLDLQVRVPALAHDKGFDAMLHRVGYLPASGSRRDSPGVCRDIPRGSQRVEGRVWDKRLFVCPDPEQPAVLHIRLLASPWGRYTVMFADWLRAHPLERDRYERIKKELARAHAADADYDDYTRAKTAYFDRVQPQFEQRRQQPT